MKIFSIHHKSIEPADIVAEGLETQFVKDGISWGALISPPVWALFHRMWLVFIGIAALYIATGIISDAIGLNANTAALLYLAIHLILALEGNNLRRWSLGRRGYIEVGVVTGNSLEKCERRFFESLLDPYNKLGGHSDIQNTRPPSAPKNPLAKLRPLGCVPDEVVGLFPEPEPKS